MKDLVAPSVDLKVEALYDCWAFFDLIDYRGGTANFDRCHYDFILVLSAYQLWQSGRLTPALAKRWALLCEYPEDLLLGGGGKVLCPPTNRLLQMPRGHLKSTLLVGYIMWRIYRNPNIRIMHATNIKELSQSFVRELRGYFEDEDLQVKVWNTRPHIKGNLVPSLDRTNRRYYGDDNESEDRKVVWSNSQLQMNRTLKAKEPTVFSTSVKAKATGQHFDLVVMDDIVDFDNCSTPTKIRQVKRWAADIASIRTKVRSTSTCGSFSEQLGDEYVVTGTHYDPGDYYSFIKVNHRDLKFGVYNRNIYANGVDNSSGYLWGQFTKSIEQELRAELKDSPGVFEAQYLNLVNNPALQVLTTDYIEWVKLEELMQNRSNVGVTFKDAEGTLDSFVPIMAVDFAISLSSRADYTAICVGGKSFQRKLVCSDFSVGHYSVEQTLQEIVRLVKLWGVKRMYVETIGFQSLYRDQILKRLADEKLSCGVIDYKPVGNKHKRIEAQLSSYFSEGQVVFSDHLKPQATVMNSFSFFGRASAKDDPPDALAVVAEHSHPPQEKASRWSNSANRRAQSNISNLSWNSRYGGLY